MMENDCRDTFKADAKSNFFPRTVEIFINSMTSGSRDFTKRYLSAQKRYVYVAKLIAAMKTKQTKSNLAAKDLKKTSSRRFWR